MSKHGMQMGPSGFGMTHGTDEDDRKRVDGYGHDHSSHGVSEKWIKDRVRSGAKKASDTRLATFHGRTQGSGDAATDASKKKGDHADKTAKKYRAASSAAHAEIAKKAGSKLTVGPRKLNKRESNMMATSKKAGDKAYAKKESGWDRWKAKKGHGMSSYDGGDCNET